MSRIRFEAGARTNWHLHSTGQLLLVEEGRGRLYEMGAGKVIDVKAGEPVYTKPNVLHWHGAAPDSHAVQFSVYSGTLEWKEAVTDEEYTGRKARWTPTPGRRAARNAMAAQMVSNASA